MSNPIEPATQPGLARCYRHPMRETGVRCGRCDRPICPDCMRPASVGFHCPDDVKLANREVRRPRTVVGAPVARSDKPWTTYTLIGLNVLIYVVTVAQSGSINAPYRSALFMDWTMSPSLVARGHEYERLVTSAFLHLSVVHVLLNMVALGFVGPFLERTLGWWRYLALYLLSAIGGSVCVFLFYDHFGSVAGASGAIYGLFAASLIMAHRIGLDLRALAATIVINFLFTFTIPGISVEGHIGGFVIGLITAVAIIGLPRTTWRPSPPLQAVGLTVVLVALVVVVAARTAVFPAVG